MLPELLSLFIPAIGAVVGSLVTKRIPPAPPAGQNAPYPVSGGPLPNQLQPQNRTQGAAQPSFNAAPPHAAPQSQTRQPQAGSPAPQQQLPEGFGPVVEYLQVLEDMIISEGQKNNLDSEIVDKSLALFARVQRVIPLLDQLGDNNINHTIRRLILKDLNGVINPFLRLSGELKQQNRRMLLNGLKDVNSKISAIVSTIEHKDLIELQSKAELIHQRYNQSEL
nr:hypothetical protein [Paenibacillus kobensis]